MIAYRIRGWLDHYQKSDLRKTHNWKWVAVPIKHDGKSFRRLMLRSPTAFGAWVLLLQVAAKCPTRGVLIEEDGPLSPEDLELKTGMPEEYFALAFDVCTEIGWLEFSQDGGKTWESDVNSIRKHPEKTPIHPETSGENANPSGNIRRKRQSIRKHPETSGDENNQENTSNDIKRDINGQMEPIRKLPEVSGNFRTTVHDITVQDRTIQKTTTLPADEIPAGELESLFSENELNAPEVKASPTKNKSQPKKEDQREKTVWGIWCLTHDYKFIARPIPAGPDLQAAKLIGKSYTDPDMLEYMFKSYLNDEDKFLVETGHALRHFISRSGKYLRAWSRKVNNSPEGQRRLDELAVGHLRKAEGNNGNGK